MLEWLKSILGDGYTDEVDAKVSAEIGKNFVSKADFNQVNAAKKKAEDDVKTRDQQLETLKKSTGDTAALQEQITTLQTQNAEAKKTYEAELARVRLDGAVEAALTAAGAKNNTAAKALLADFLSGAKLAEDGTVEGLEGAVKALTEDTGTAFLFEKADSGLLPGAKPADAGRADPAGQKFDGPVII